MFKTSLGALTGNPVTPVIKVSSNSALAKKMPDIIDVDTGSVTMGEKSIQEMGEEIIDYVIAVSRVILILMLSSLTIVTRINTKRIIIQYNSTNLAPNH